MAHCRGGFRGRGRGISETQRRKKTWVSMKGLTTAGGASEFFTSIVITTPAPAATFDHTEVGIALINDPDATTEGFESSSLGEEVTILRARGSLDFAATNGLPAGTAPLVTQQFAFGMGVTDVRSLIAGVFPGPIIDSDWDGWMFLRQSTLKPLDTNATIVDVKSMRKIESGDALFFAAQSVSGAGAGVTGDFIFDMRFLILLP